MEGRGVGRVVHRAGERSEPCSIRVHVVVHGRGEVGATVIPVVQDGNFCAPGVFAGDFDRVLKGFGT